MKAGHFPFVDVYKADIVLCPNIAQHTLTLVHCTMYLTLHSVSLKLCSATIDLKTLCSRCIELTPELIPRQTLYLEEARDSNKHLFVCVYLDGCIYWFQGCRGTTKLFRYLPLPRRQFYSIKKIFIQQTYWLYKHHCVPKLIN